MDGQEEGRTEWFLYTPNKNFIGWGYNGFLIYADS